MVQPYCASYARFLWETEEEDDEGEGDIEREFSPPSILQGPPPRAAAAASWARHHPSLVNYLYNIICYDLSEHLFLGLFLAIILSCE